MNVKVVHGQALLGAANSLLDGKWKIRQIDQFSLQQKLSSRGLQISSGV